MITSHGNLRLTESELRQALWDRDPKAIEAIYNMYGNNLSYQLLQGLKNPELVKDTLQIVICKIWDKGIYYDSSKGRVYTWMLNITRNYMVDVLRSRRYKKSQVTDHIDGVYDLVDSRLALEKNIDTIDISTYLSVLDPHHQELVKLHYIKGYTHVEISEMLHIPLGTIKTRLRLSIILMGKTFNPK